jgi:hypothetical protein
VLRAVGRVETNRGVTMEQMARAIAGGPRLLLRALVICFLAVLWLLLSQSAADASGRDDAPGLSVARAVHDTVASTRDTVQDRRRHAADSAAESAPEPVADAARDAEETSRRATEDVVRTVEGVARETAETADDTIADMSERVRAVAQEATRQVTEIVENPDTVVAPRPAPERPGPDGRDTDDPAPAAQSVEVHESLVTQENPAFLVPPATPVRDLVRAAAQTTHSIVVDALSSPEPAPLHGAALTDAPPAHGGSGQQVPTPTQAVYVGEVVPAVDLVLVTGALGRALDPPADRATSPGTTPD